MTIKLEAKTRTLKGKKVFALRAQDEIPGVLYGHDVENQVLTLPYGIFDKAYQEAGENTIIDLAIDGKEPVKVLIGDIQMDEIKQRFSHVDFKQINMNEKITANVELNFVGEAPIIKAEGGSLVHNLSELEIRCLPGDLIHDINVDISSLVTYDNVITLADLKIPANIEVVGHDNDTIIANAVPAKIEVEEPVVVAPVEGAEGAAPAEGATPEAGKDVAAKPGAEKKEEKK